MENSTREGGALDEERERENITTKTQSCMMVNGRMINGMGLARLSSLINLNFKASLKMMSQQKQITKGSQNSLTQMATSLKLSVMGISMMESYSAMGRSNIKMGTTTKASSKTAKNLDLESSFTLRLKQIKND